MYEEDRQITLSMYERMFDETADEQALAQLLVSPTRQAVVLARSYDAKERKLQIESRSMDENYMPDPEDIPSFIFVIDKVAQQAAELGVKTQAVAEGQVSIFDEPEIVDSPAAPAVQAEKAVEAPAAEEVEEAPVKAEDSFELPEPDREEPAAAPANEEAQPAEEERSSVDETADAVDAFLADFTVKNGELVSSKPSGDAQTEVEEAFEASSETADDTKEESEAAAEEEARPAAV